MIRVRRNGRTATVATVAAASAAALLVGATGAMAGGTTAAAPAAPAAASTVDTVDTCKFPVQGLKVSVRLTLRSETDNDVKRIKVRASNKNDTGSFYKKGATITKVTITVSQQDGDAISKRTYVRTSSPAYVDLNTGTTGAEVTTVQTKTEWKMANKSTAKATCHVNLEDSN